MTIDELQWMTELFRVGKMSKAAENLFITQPALSQCVQRIEQQLGFKLFERSNKGLKPTPKGQLFYETARQITNAYQQFLYQAELLDQQQIREITIGAASYLSYCCSVDMLSALKKKFPSISFQIYEASTHDLLEALHENRIQLLITLEAVRKTPLTNHPFGAVPCGIFLRAGSDIREHAYQKDGKWFLDPVYLLEEPIVVARKDQGTRLVSEQILEEAGVKPNIIAESGRITTRLKYAIEGIASSVGPITGEAVALNRQQSESIIYRIPPEYQHASARFTICALPDVDKLLPKELFAVISSCVLENKEFGMEKPSHKETRT